MMSKFQTEVVLLIAALSMMAMLGACAKTEQVAMQAPPAPSFLPNPGLMQKGQSGQFDRVYLEPGANWGSYTKILLEPVTIWTGPGSDMDKTSPQTQKALAGSLFTDLYNAFSKRCQMVTEPSSGTAIVRVALIDATSVNPTLNTISTYEPHIRLLDILAGKAFDNGVAYWVGTATIEGYGKDATTGALLWQGADERAGTKAWGRDTFNSWDDVDNGFKAWAAQTDKRLAALGVCPSKRTS
jgi:hypothetical protein